MPVCAAYVTGDIQPPHPPSHVYIYLAAASNVIIEEYMNMNRYTRSMHTIIQVHIRHAHAHVTVCNREIGTGISEASKRVSIFPFDTQGGKQASSYFRQRNWVQAREAQIRFPAG